MTETDEVAIVREADGTLRLEGDDPPPVFVAFQPELLDMLRRSGCAWTSLDGDTVTMRVKPEPLYYRLTGETDLGGGHVARRMTHDGKVWTHADADR